MTQYPQEYATEMNTHPLLRLNEATVRLEREHIELEEKLLELYGTAKTIGRGEGGTDWLEQLWNLRNKASLFLNELDTHSAWEERDLFPLINLYFGENRDYFGLMEQEHELAKQYITAFVAGVDQSFAPVDGRAAKETAGYLLQAYAILADHFKMEEDIVFDLEDRSNAYGY